MVFYSLQFFIFLPIVFLVHYYSGIKTRSLVLLFASIFFYATFLLPHLLLALALVVGVTYLVGLRIGDGSGCRGKKALFIVGICTNLLILVSIKYMPVIAAAINSALSWLHIDLSVPAFPLLVSIGVSYFVFQAISYLIDVFLGIEEPERDPVNFALYLSFFPKLLQGPIERAGDLLPQLRSPYEFRYDVVRSGLLLFTWGMFKKLVVADRIALYVDMVYADVHGNSGAALLCATYLYAFQLYFDFSGYTDMALGCARLFNIQLTQNFNSPYLATSVADFWRRWHISFSRWILDYIFKPLQMSLRTWGSYGSAFALLVTFLVSGIWHGATWGFVVWGLLHGVFLAISVFYRPIQKRIHKGMNLQGTRLLKSWQIIVTFNLVCFTWVFFRGATLADSWHLITSVFNGIVNSLLTADFSGFFILGKGKSRFLQSLLPLSVPLVVFLFKGKDDFFSRPRWFRWGVYYLLVYTIIYHSVINSKAQFVYFQF